MMAVTPCLTGLVNGGQQGEHGSARTKLYVGRLCSGRPSWCTTLGRAFHIRKLAVSAALQVQVHVHQTAHTHHERKRAGCRCQAKATPCSPPGHIFTVLL